MTTPSVSRGAFKECEVTLTRERSATANVIGILPGRDARLGDQAIVVGAHYDHLGRGGEGSLAPDQAGAIHHGADDNASGTAVVLALARAFAAAGGAPRTLVFVAFSGEEMGLLGSAHYVRQPPVALDTTAVMLNLDMVGRLRDGKAYVGGVDSGTGLRAIVTAAARERRKRNTALRPTANVFGLIENDRITGAGGFGATVSRAVAAGVC